MSIHGESPEFISPDGGTRHDHATSSRLRRIESRRHDRIDEAHNIHHGLTVTGIRQRQMLE